MSLYAPDGSINVTVVDGTTLVGAYAADGSLNVFEVTGTERGVYHPCGALNVTNTTDPGAYAADGSRQVSETDTRKDGGMYVTVVSGAFAA